MSVFRHPKSPYYQIEFRIDGRTFRGSSKTRNEKEAKSIEREWRKKALADLEEGKRTGVGPLTLSLAAGRYMSEVMAEKSSELDTYRSLERLIAFVDGGTLMSAITDAHVSAYIAKRRRDPRWGRNRYKDGKVMDTVSNATINREVAVLKRLFMRARRTWKVTLPNEPDWRGHLLPEERERTREIQQDETDKLYTNIRDDYRPWLEFAHSSGLRLAETLIRWTAVNFKTGEIRTRGKANKWVKVQMTSSIRSLLESQIGNHPEYVFTYVAARTNKKEGRVRGQRYPITYAGIQSLWKRLIVTSDVANLRIHDIRHDFASKLLRVSGNLKLVSRALNHSDVSVTAKYAHVLDSDIAEAMEAVVNSRKISRNNSGEAA